MVGQKPGRAAWRIRKGHEENNRAQEVLKTALCGNSSLGNGEGKRGSREGKDLGETKIIHTTFQWEESRPELDGSYSSDGGEERKGAGRKILKEWGGKFITVPSLLEKPNQGDRCEPRKFKY